MDELFDLILKNPLLLIIIIGAIMKFLTGNKKKEEKQNERPINRPRPTPTPSGGSRPVSIPREEVKPVPQTIQRVSIEERQQRQLQQLANRLNRVSTQEVKDPTEQGLEHQDISFQGIGSERQSLPLNHRKTIFKKQIKGNLTGKGLIDSIVMAEVLGRPRAQKPYQSIVMNRKK